jgi:hypothetical protein
MGGQRGATGGDGAPHSCYVPSVTSRERIDAAFRHEPVDRTPVFEYVLLSPVADALLGRQILEYLGEPGPWIQGARAEGLEEAVRRYARDRVELAALLGHDMLYVAPNPLPDAPSRHDPLAEIGESFTLDAGGDPVERLRARNERVARGLEKPLPRDSYRVYGALREEMRARDLDLPILAPAYYHGIWTDADLMQVMLLDPEVAAEHFRLATRRALAVIDDYAREGIEMIGIGGDFAGNQLLVSPDAYRRFIVPEVRACAEAVRARGARSVNASDGNLWPVIDDFLLGCGVDAYLEIDQAAGMDLAALVARFGATVTFLGNMDCGRTLSFADGPEIRRATHAILAAGVAGAHVFTASNAITASVPTTAYLAMVDAYREYFHLPRRPNP